MSAACGNIPFPAAIIKFYKRIILEAKYLWHDSFQELGRQIDQMKPRHYGFERRSNYINCGSRRYLSYGQQKLQKTENFTAALSNSIADNNERRSACCKQRAVLDHCGRGAGAFH